MNEQARRTQRLFHLREQQHARTEIDLRAAQMELGRQENALLSVRTQMRQIREGEHEALQSGAPYDWMIASAELEVAGHLGLQHIARREAAARNVAEASSSEQAARIASKQMKSLVDKAQQLALREAMHEEQFRLDEIGRNLRALSKQTRYTASTI